MTEKVDLPARYERIHELCDEKHRRLHRLVSFCMAFRSLWDVRSVKKCPDAGSARLQAHNRANSFEEDLEPYRGIKVFYHGFEETAEVAEQSLLIVGNHQGIESQLHFNKFLNETAEKVVTVLKRQLTEYGLGFGEAIKKLEPLIAERPELDESLSRRESVRKFTAETRAAIAQAGVEVKNSIESGNPTLVYLEGRRSKNGNLLSLQENLIADSVSYLQANSELPQTITVLTSSVMGAFPRKIDDHFKRPLGAPINQTPIHFFRDVISVEDKDIKEILAEIKETMTNNLDWATAHDIELLEKAA